MEQLSSLRTRAEKETERVSETEREVWEQKPPSEKGNHLVIFNLLAASPAYTQVEEFTQRHEYQEVGIEVILEAA